jgi:hypothetical protein
LLGAEPPATPGMDYSHGLFSEIREMFTDQVYIGYQIGTGGLIYEIFNRCNLIWGIIGTAGMVAY